MLRKHFGGIYKKRSSTASKLGLLVMILSPALAFGPPSRHSASSRIRSGDIRSDR